MKRYIIHFADKHQMDRAFYELIHSKAQFNGIGKNTLIVDNKDCIRLKRKNIKFHKKGL